MLTVLLASSCIALQAGNKHSIVLGSDDDFNAYETSKKKNPLNDGIQKVVTITSGKIKELKEELQTTNDQESVTNNKEIVRNSSLKQQLTQTKGTKIFDFVNINKTEIAAGLAAVVIVGGTLYVLYKNGTLKKLSDWIKENPKRTAQVCVVVASVVATGAALKYYGLPAVKNPFVRA